MTAGELFPSFIDRQKWYDKKRADTKEGENKEDIAKLTKQLQGQGLAVKDLFHIAGIPTSAGNPDWLATHAIPKQTHSSILKLLQHGAHYLGKTLTDELAYSLNGSNIHYPPLINPKTPERLAGGSSSGSAVAVASHFADIGLGTDTGGSIRVPASYNGLFGIRTSQSAIPCDNMVPLAPSFDTVGWMTRSLDSLKKVSEILLPDAKVQSKAKYSIAVARNLVQQSEQAEAIESWLAELTNVEHKEITLDTDAFNTSETFRVLQGYEIWQQHGDWLRETQPKFGDDIAARFKWCENISLHSYQTALCAQHEWQQHIASIIDNFDAILIPTTPGRAPLLTINANESDRYRSQLMSLTAIAGLAGLPQLHLPVFSIESAPCGLSLIAAKHQDLSLIQIAASLLK